MAPKKAAQKSTAASDMDLDEVCWRVVEEFDCNFAALQRTGILELQCTDGGGTQLNRMLVECGIGNVSEKRAGLVRAYYLATKGGNVPQQGGSKKRKSDIVSATVSCPRPASGSAKVKETDQPAPIEGLAANFSHIPTLPQLAERFRQDEAELRAGDEKGEASARMPSYISTLFKLLRLPRVPPPAPALASSRSSTIASSSSAAPSFEVVIDVPSGSRSSPAKSTPPPRGGEKVYRQAKKRKHLDAAVKASYWRGAEREALDAYASAIIEYDRLTDSRSPDAEADEVLQFVADIDRKIPTSNIRDRGVSPDYEDSQRFETPPPPHPATNRVSFTTIGHGDNDALMSEDELDQDDEEEEVDELETQHNLVSSSPDPVSPTRESTTTLRDQDSSAPEDQARADVKVKPRPHPRVPATIEDEGSATEDEFDAALDAPAPSPSNRSVIAEEAASSALGPANDMDVDVPAPLPVRRPLTATSSQEVVIPVDVEPKPTLDPLRGHAIKRKLTREKFPRVSVVKPVREHLVRRSMAEAGFAAAEAAKDDVEMVDASASV